MSEARNKFVRYIKEQLIGGEMKDNILLGEQPSARFFTGLLFPIMQEDISLEGMEEYSNDEAPQIQSVKNTQRYMPPSSVGFSFFIKGNAIKLRVFYNAVNFLSGEEKDEKNQKFVAQSWHKKALAGDEEVEFTLDGKMQYKVFDGRAKIDALWRQYSDGYIITLTLSNQQKIADNLHGREFSKQRNEKTLFEVEFKCIVESGEVANYPATEKSLLNVEEREIQLRYQDLKTYAVGHGAATNWQKNQQGDMEIWADFMPQVEVPQVTADTGGNNNKVLAFDFLQQDHNVTVELEAFVRHYEQWIDLQTQKSSNETDIAQSIIKNLNIAKQRMQQGVVLLKENSKAKIAFAVMNQAMLMQWQQGDRNKNKVREKSTYRWRPFQLGFILMTLKSSIDENDDYRDTLDLIWFPTGGGKTEAYLGLMAFLFIYRRLENPASGGGTVAIMRYTLKLLTAQQFVRANKVIFALELIRQQNRQFGKESFSSGLWVGQTTSPNTFKQAFEYVKDDKLEKFVINSCPWCETKFKRHNYQATEQDFYFCCTNNDCDFGKIPSKQLPCNVVDEALYLKPPSLLIATVDKFARLCWESRATGFFGGSRNKPPELIIQDELHLIADALGSIVGLYEVGIETALMARGVNVKYIASTATIKNAKQQVKALFAKEMQIFPPSGLRYDDSYFAKVVPLSEKSGRLYMGYLAPLLNRQQCLRPLAATLLSAPTELFKDEEAFLDNWWTQIIYHGSLKGLSNSNTLYQGTIESRLNSIILENLTQAIDKVSPNFCSDENIKTMDDFLRITQSEIKQIVDQYLPVRDLTIKELSSQRSAEENNQIFNALTKEHHEEQSIDVALATNMVATGLDVSRLALMIINGQPLTTAEYIQASSRVGRGETPGIVFINYYKTQARSLSHYENFRSYHEGFYRFVEPSSLTPFTYQARTRALHSALVIAIRHSNIKLLDNNRAGDFDKTSDAVKKVIQLLKIRCKNAISNNNTKIQTLAHIDKILDDWQAEVAYCQKNRIKMVYYENDRGSHNLICNFDKDNGLWQTLQSMRNVENSALIKLIPGLKKDEG
ncbi:Superfamily II DNA and RNA helicase [hydrothermal vent metagenome]|uniref:Superfamily II DNA and RNA helicase n=1 Tax=hydrothermal vent metagenome TaxID=652676 RepID=A0A1W1E6A2_9ZZZZ